MDKGYFIATDCSVFASKVTESIRLKGSRRVPFARVRVELICFEVNHSSLLCRYNFSVTVLGGLCTHLNLAGG